MTTVVENLKSRSKDVSGSEEIAQVGIKFRPMATVKVGEKIAEAMEKVGKEGVITVEEAKGLEFELDVVEGMQFDLWLPVALLHHQPRQDDRGAGKSLYPESTRRSCRTCRQCCRSLKLWCSRAVRC